MSQLPFTQLAFWLAAVLTACRAQYPAHSCSSHLAVPSPQSFSAWPRSTPKSTLTAQHPAPWQQRCQSALPQPGLRAFWPPAPPGHGRGTPVGCRCCWVGGCCRGAGRRSPSSPPSRGSRRFSEGFPPPLPHFITDPPFHGSPRPPSPRRTAPGAPRRCDLAEATGRPSLWDAWSRARPRAAAPPHRTVPTALGTRCCPLCGPRGALHHFAFWC